MRAFVCVAAVLFLLGQPAWAVDPAPLPQEIEKAKIVFIVNQGAENSILDNVYDRFRKWSRWTLTTERDKADLIVVLSAQNYYLGMINLGSTTTTSATATSFGSTTTIQGTSTTKNNAIPLVSYPRYLTLVDARTGMELVGVSCELRLSKGYTAKVLVDRLKARFPKNER